MMESARRLRRERSWSNYADFADKRDAAGCRALGAPMHRAASTPRSRFPMSGRHRYHRQLPALAMLACIAASGCALLPDRIVEPQFHNPFPQIFRVAVLPFFNQSAEPTVDGDTVAMAYYNELQTIPGFEVMPVGVAKQMLAASIAATRAEPRGGADFQRLARMMNVDAVLVGSITEYSPYYPPRIGISVDWYAANSSFHPIPPGYGLPWGRAEEEFIPSTLVREAEFALAREQLSTQTPDLPEEDAGGAISRTAHQKRAVESLPPKQGEQLSPPAPSAPPADASAVTSGDVAALSAPKLPQDWPDPRGFIPPPPRPERPTPLPQQAPVITHTRIYHGQD